MSLLKNEVNNKIFAMTITPLRIQNAHGTVAFALINRPRMGDLIVQMCK
jgi:hypothetical protein